MGKLIFLVFLFISLNLSLGADDFLEGIDAYNRGEYLRAIQHFEEYLIESSDEPSDRQLLAKAYLGASQFILGRHSVATGWFLSILRDNYEYEVNPVYFPPEIVAFFNEVKLTVSPVVFKKEQKHFYLNFLPFGAGQFQNKEYIKGVLIAGLEVIALSVNLDTYFRRKALEEGGMYPEDRLSEAKRLQNIQIISGGIFIAGYIYGVIDSYLDYRKKDKEIGLSFFNQGTLVSLTYKF